MSSRTAQLQDVWAMLDECLRGHQRRDHGDHHWRVTMPGFESFPYLPLGKHGKGRRTGRAEIELGYIRQLARHFKISACANKHFPQIKA